MPLIQQQGNLRTVLGSSQMYPHLSNAHTLSPACECPNPPTSPGWQNSFQDYLSDVTKSAIAFACSSFSPEMPLLWGALLCGSPLVMCCTI